MICDMFPNLRICHDVLSWHCKLQVHHYSHCCPPPPPPPRQVTTYNEDFHKERADRERAQGAIQSLKEERESLTQVINLLVRWGGVRGGGGSGEGVRASHKSLTCW